MKSFLRENPTIAFGLGLPLLLVVIFLLISGIPTLTVASPQYDVLYVTGYNNRLNSVQILVKDHKVQVIHQTSPYGNQTPRLWRYIAETGAVKEIPILRPPGSAPVANRPYVPTKDSEATVIDVPDLDGLTVDSSSIAPDGYEFSGAYNRHSRNVFGGLFYSSRYNNQAVLTKNGRRIRLPNAVDHYYSRNTQFVGWVVSQ